MPIRSSFAFALPLLLCAACQSVAPAPAAGSAPAPAAGGALGGSEKASAVKGALEKAGIVAPGRFDALVLVPEQYSGGFSVLEVLPHGTAVKSGDVIAKLDARAIDEELHRAQLELASAEIRHQGVVERNKLEAAAAALSLEQSKSSLERARRALAGYKEFELAFDKRQEELSKRNQQANVEDQVDELDQLEKMYKGDALVDATEDIVLKRSRRQLDLTRLGVELSLDRVKYREEYEKKMTLAQREESLRSQEESHLRTVKTQELEARSRADAELRSSDSLREQRERFAKLGRDRALFELRAPRDGVLLHGGAKDFRPGRNPARYERYSTLAAKAEVFLVADPDPASVNFDLTDTELARARSGARVRVESLSVPGATAQGTLTVENYPRSASAGEATYEAKVTLDAPLSGVVHGSRAKVVIESGKADA